MARRREGEAPEAPAVDPFADLRALVESLAAERDEALQDLKAAKLRFGAVARPYMEASLRLTNLEHAADLAQRARDAEKARSQVGTLDLAGHGTVAASTVERRR